MIAVHLTCIAPLMTFVELPFESLSRMSLQSHVDAIGTENTSTKKD